MNQPQAVATDPGGEKRKSTCLKEFPESAKEEEIDKCEAEM